MMTVKLKGVLGCVCLVFMLTAGSCKNNGGTVTPNPPVVTDQSACQAACDNLKSLGCEQARPIDMGVRCSTAADCKDLDGNVDAMQACVDHGCFTSCVSFCIITENAGVWLDPLCVGGITSCDGLETCPLAQKPLPRCTGPACSQPSSK